MVVSIILKPASVIALLTLSAAVSIIPEDMNSPPGLIWRAIIFDSGIITSARIFATAIS